MVAILAIALACVVFSMSAMSEITRDVGDLQTQLSPIVWWRWQMFSSKAQFFLSALAHQRPRNCDLYGGPQPTELLAVFRFSR
jgi:hypothetical protein